MSISIIVLISSIVLTYMLRAYALRRQILDIPNERSSHVLATPKGGGLAIITVFLGVMTYLYIHSNIDSALFWSLWCVLPITVVSMVDDIFTLSVKFRFFVQIVSSLLALYTLGGVDSLNLGSFVVKGGWWINIIALVSIVWFTNLYNFLDGLDGYAASETVFVGLSIFLLFDNEVGLYLALASLGFLVFNWPKASFFMGDVGSASLGFIFAILLLNDIQTPHFLSWVILLSLFWFDATITIVRRFKNQEKLFQAHKKHMYQRLHQAGWSHQKVLLGSILFNLLLLALLWFVQAEHYLYLLGSILLILWVMLKYIDRQKEFE